MIVSKLLHAVLMFVLAIVCIASKSSRRRRDAKEVVLELAEVSHAGAPSESDSLGAPRLLSGLVFWSGGLHDPFSVAHMPRKWGATCERISACPATSTRR